jgi:hypothetical protein
MKAWTRSGGIGFWTGWRLAVAVGLGLLPFVVAGFFAEPVADDYAYAYRLLSESYGQAWLTSSFFPIFNL